MKKKIALLLCSILIISALAACGSSVSYRDDVPAADIATAVDAVISTGADMSEFSETYITGSMQLSVENYSDYCAKIVSKGITVNEYGIFKGTDENHAKTIQSELEAYLQRLVDSWMPEYRPEEFPKLENAEVKVCGTYVMYAILSDEEKAAAFAAFENAIKAS